ncbi:MAG: hypothetical protein IKN64_05115 [Desulfovibrio sp.]|nr:hypothetical protein [Desulfovibrio sp.]
MSLDNEKETEILITKTINFITNADKSREIENKKVEVMEKKLFDLLKRVHDGTLTDQDVHDIEYTIPNDIKKYEEGMRYSRIDEVDYKIYKLLKQFITCIEKE